MGRDQTSVHERSPCVIHSPSSSASWTRAASPSMPGDPTRMRCYRAMRKKLAELNHAPFVARAQRLGHELVRVG